ncbi:MAG: polymer-forming cytoskeletal protein [Vicinamibacterales bacterium]
MIGGRTLVIKGDISGSEELVIAGRVEGSITLSGQTLTLAPESQVSGTVVAASVIVAGKLDGRIEAEERVEIRATAVVDGEISTPRLAVVDGAVLTTTVGMPAGTRRTRAA